MYLNSYINEYLKKIFLILFLKLIFFSQISNSNFEKKLLTFIRRNKVQVNNKNEKSYLNSIQNYIDLIYSKKIASIYFNDKINKPKVSFIATVFNKENYLIPLILSIQHQNLRDFEIIFIDDYSTDDSVNLINNFIKIDTRIKLIKNKGNKGTLYSRCSGAIYSQGEYIIFIDSDDLILKDGLYNSYNYIRNNKLSMIQFNTIFNWKEKLELSKRYYRYKNIIKQPFLSYIFFYNEITHKGIESNTALWDKLLDRDLVGKAIKYIGKNYIRAKIKIENDVILLFSLFQIADSYQYIDEIGYFYIRTHTDSITNSWKDPDISNKIVFSIFTNIKFLYEKSRNTYLDKLFCLYKLKKSFDRYNICFIHSAKEYNLIKEVFKILLSSNYISKADKIMISNIEISITNLIFQV